jgi:hypothetical protein
MLRNSLLWSIAAIIVACGSSLAAEQDTTGWKPNSGKDLEITIPKLNASPKIDGVLDEDCWNEAKRVGNFVEIDPGDNIKPAVETDVLLGYDNQNIYFGFICHEKDAKQIRATLCNRDEIGNDDMAIVLIDTYGDLKRGYIFIVNPYGVQLDGYQTGDTDPTFDTNWKSAAKILDDKWTVEMAVPFKSIRFPEKEAQHWRVTFARIRPRDSQCTYAWTPISRDIPSLWTQSGHLWINERLLGSKRHIEFLPYVIGSQSGYLDDDNACKFHNDWGWPSIGLSAKYGLTSNLTLDLALNPDYSQIESDAVQIDVNTRFALYYSEKRPFFIEGGDLFDTKVTAVYTRAINDPFLAARLTGKIGKTAIGYVIARDDHTPWVVPFGESSYSISSDKKSLSNIVRIKHDVLEDSYIGFMGTDREFLDSYNRVTGLDGSIRFLNNYFFSFQALRSWTKEPDDTTIFAGYSDLTFGKNSLTSAFDGESFNGTAYEFGFDRSARHWSFSLWYDDYSPTFRADNGFISENDFRNYGAWTGVHLWPKKWVLEETQPQISVGTEYNYDGELKTRWLNPSIWMRLKKQTYLSMWSNLQTSRYADTTFSGIWNIGADLSNTYSDLIMAEVWFTIGKGINYVELGLGHSRDIGLWTQIKPTKKFRTTFVYDRYWMLDSEGKAKSLFQQIFRNTLTYQFSRHLSFRLVIQYSYTEIPAYDYSGSEFQVDPLISYELNPFTVFYFGSNHDVEDFGNPCGVRESGREIFLKLRYQFRTTPEDMFNKFTGVFRR